MKTKLVLWGTNAQDEKILIGMELRVKDNMVNIYTFPEAVATDEFSQKMMQDWRNNVEVAFPEGGQTIERELTISDSLLPDDIRVERTDVVNRAQTEWHFIVLSSKLNEVYENELGELKDKVEQLTEYSSDVWGELKGFWSKVQEQVQERNLFRDHANALRDNTNGLFDQMKKMRAALDADFMNISKAAHSSLMGSLQDIETRIAGGQGRLSAVFDELKDLQRQFRDTKLTREHRSEVWNRLDAMFKTVKEKRFGANANNESSAVDRLQRRYNGLINAIDKMQKSINRDRNDLTFQDRRIANTEGQLEAQIRQAKIKMIQERISSKEDKLKEMDATKTELEQRLQALKEKEAKRAERKKLEEAKKAAKAKIAENIKSAEVARVSDSEQSEKLEKAAEAIAKKDVTAPKVAETSTEQTAEIIENVESTSTEKAAIKPVIEAAPAAVVAASTIATPVTEVLKSTQVEKPTTEDLIANAVDTAVGITATESTESNETTSSEEE